MEQSTKTNISTWLLTLGIVGIISSIITWLLNKADTTIPPALLISGIVFLFLSIIFGLNNIKLFFAKRTTKKGLTSIITFIILIAILVSLYIVAKNHPRRVDMTEDKQFSLSKQTIDILKDLKTEYKITVMGKENEKNLFTGETILDPQMVELLKSYKNNTEKIDIIYLSPYENKELFNKYNLQPGDGLGAMIIEKKNEPAQNVILLQRDLIEMSYQTRQAKFVGESKLSSVLAGFTAGIKNIIYVTEGHGEKSLDKMDQHNLGKLKGKIKLEGYKLKTINLRVVNEVPADASMLLIPGPETAFSKDEIQKLKGFFTKGGRTMILLDPAVQKAQSGLGDLLKEYGIKIDNSYTWEGNPNYVPARNAFGQPVSFYHYVQFGFHKIVDQLNQNNLYIFLVYSQPFIIDQKFKNENITITPLLTSSDSSWGEKGGKKDQFDKGKDTKGPLNIALAVTDNFGKKEKPENEMRLVLIGDTDFIKNGFANQQGTYEYGRDLFLNSVGWLTQQEKKITIRPKDIKERKLFITEQRIIIIFLITVIIIPFGVVGLGILYNRSRKRQK